MNKDLLILLGFAGLGLLLIFRKGPIGWPSLSSRTLQPVRKHGTYKNTETMDIEWNNDGLPVKVTIHRDAVMS